MVVEDEGLEVDDAETLARIGQAMRVRRDELGITADQARSRAATTLGHDKPMSNATWSGIEQGKVRAHNGRVWRSVCAGLDWEFPVSIERLRAGLEPVPLPTEPVLQLPERVAFLEQTVGELKDTVSAVHNTLDTLTQMVDELQSALDRELKRRNP
jgi:uncharacterized coiled-coil protein SlyX